MTGSAPPELDRRARDHRAADLVVERRSQRIFGLFARIFTYDLSRSFHAVRLLGVPPQTAGPIVIVANHPSWWDAALFTWLAATMFVDKRAFAPIEADMLRRYPFFARLGAFGVKSGSFASASAFMTVAQRVLATSDGLMFVNAEGRFSDVRSRPLEVSPGLAHLARAAPPGVTILPLAIDYVYWNERRSNLLLHFGEPIPVASFAGLSTKQSCACLADALTTAMDALADAATTRDPGRFHTLLAGSVGINAFYDLWRGAKARAKGQHFTPAHGDRP